MPKLQTLSLDSAQLSHHTMKERLESPIYLPSLRGPHTHTTVGGGRHNQSLALGKVDGDDAAEVSTPGQEGGGHVTGLGTITCTQ